MINLYTQKEPLILPEITKYNAEYLCIVAAKHCRISPASRHLFALWNPNKNIWYSPCKIIDVGSNKDLNLYFRLRFHPSDVKKLAIDQQACNYYFHQMRHDFLQGKIKQLSNNADDSFGLAVTDIIRTALEQDLNPEQMKIEYSNFLPKVLHKWNLFMLKERINKAIIKAFRNSGQNVAYVKQQYIQHLITLVPDYTCEHYQAQIDENGKVYEVFLRVCPYVLKNAGLQMQIKGSKESWIQICSIEDLCYISMRNDGTVEISRRNGIPQYLTFQSVDQMHSFVSLLDGYYRLIEKWTFNICKDLITPSLLNLRQLKCHGPIGQEFSYQKLREKCKNEVGCYILRESTTVYHEYRLDVSETDGFIQTYYILRNDDDEYFIKNKEETFPSLPQLISHYSKGNNNPLLKKCIPPSEYEKTCLLLCRPINRDIQALKSRGECNCAAQCIPYDSIIFSKKVSGELHGHQTIVKHCYLRRGTDNFKEVAVKQLKHQLNLVYTMEFLNQCDKVLFWQCDSIVSTIGMVLSPLCFVMEYLPLGRLDLYLRENNQALQQVDLVEAANYIARALWYLEEQQCCHGKIRCHNILVSQHSDNSFKVKLADPGIVVYNDEDMHWIPPECYSDFSQAAKSLAADVWAFGTTLWEIFSFGEIPFKDKKTNEIKELYLQGHHPPYPTDIHSDIGKLMNECWTFDLDNRKKAQAIMRDINQILYEVYNSRRSHSYATINSSQNLSNGQSSPIPPTPPPATFLHRNETVVMNHRNNFLKNPFRLVSSNITNFNYDRLSSGSMTSSQSTSTIISETTINEVPVDSLISIDESEFRDVNTSVLETNPQSHWIIDKNQLNFGERLGQGFYGEVYKATLTYCAGCTEVVAVKRIKKSALSEESFRGLSQEIDIMKKLRHANIVEIKAFVEEPEIMLVMEYMKLGSLLAYLQMHKQKIERAQLLKFAADVAEGMKYLEEKHIVHRDLAVRNILVASEDCVKISDFGLARLTENDYYRMKTERDLPIRWYALESILHLKFSHKSDVWSFGITLWEMFSYGENPIIPGISDTKLAEALQKGTRLGCPQSCPVEIYRLMIECWDSDSHKRPSFSDIREQIEDLRKSSWT
ncbi:tyrosine-protein kinase JAK2-like [Centruroides vittatus]|uniref:tyrosine-protein kinase JAK2-like n=1 Tax=Centruroides vittatus TaxID=120091 RepID=UPI00350EBAD1